MHLECEREKDERYWDREEEYRYLQKVNVSTIMRMGESRILVTYPCQHLVQPEEGLVTHSYSVEQMKTERRCSIHQSWTAGASTACRLGSWTYYCIPSDCPLQIDLEDILVEHIRAEDASLVAALSFPHWDSSLAAAAAVVVAFQHLHAILHNTTS